MAGLFIGGYNANSTGDATDCLIAHNTFYNNDTDPSADEYGQIYIQYRVSETTFVSNILYHDITKNDGYNTFIVQWNGSGSNIIFDRNLHYGPGTPVSVINNKWIEGFNAYQNQTISGPNELWGPPQFVAADTLDFSLEPLSPGIDLGDASYTTEGELDLLGQQRVRGLAPDAGAIETGSARPHSGTLTLEHDATLTLDWTVPTGLSYTIEHCKDLQNWLPMPGYDSLRSSSGSEQLALAAGLAQQQFFRVSFQ